MTLVGINILIFRCFYRHFCKCLETIFFVSKRFFFFSEFLIFRWFYRYFMYLFKTCLKTIFCLQNDASFARVVFPLVFIVFCSFGNRGFLASAGESRPISPRQPETMPRRGPAALRLPREEAGSSARRSIFLVICNAETRLGQFGCVSIPSESTSSRGICMIHSFVLLGICFSYFFRG